MFTWNANIWTQCPCRCGGSRRRRAGARTGSTLELAAHPRTDWFVDPSGGRAPMLDGAALVGDATGDFMFSARVTVGFAATFDAGVLLLHVSDTVWAKLCFEFSPQKEPMVVSVVTRGTSDDANGFVVDGDAVWLRIARMGTCARIPRVDGRSRVEAHPPLHARRRGARRRLRGAVADRRGLRRALRRDPLRAAPPRRPARRLLGDGVPQHADALDLDFDRVAAAGGSGRRAGRRRRRAASPSRSRRRARA